MSETITLWSPQRTIHDSRAWWPPQCAGKTFTAVSFVYRLIKHARAQQVLFLVDRRNLGRQALNVFRQYVTPDDGHKFSELDNIQHMQSNLLDPVSQVCITTIQRLYSMLRIKAEFDPAPVLLKRILAERRVKWEKENPGRRYVEPKEPNVDGLPELAEGWLWTEVGQLFDVTIDGTPARSKPEYWNGDIPWVSSGDVRFNRIRMTRESIASEGLSNSNAKQHPPGTVLLAMIGEGKTRGRAALLEVAATTNLNVALHLHRNRAVTPHLRRGTRQALLDLGRGDGRQPTRRGHASQSIARIKRAGAHHAQHKLILAAHYDQDGYVRPVRQARVVGQGCLFPGRRHRFRDGPP